MFFPIARLFIRLSLLFFLVRSIFYFYVFWYRYSFEHDLVYKTSWIYNFKIFSNKHYFYLWNRKIYLVDNQVTLYSFFEWQCNTIIIWDYKDYICFKWNRFNKFVFIDKSVIKLSYFKWSYFIKLNLKSDLYKNYYFKVNWINFILKNNWDLLYKDDLWEKKLINIWKSKILWYLENTIIFEKKWHLFKLTRK